MRLKLKIKTARIAAKKSSVCITKIDNYKLYVASKFIKQN
jgi:hypothetical protein